MPNRWRPRRESGISSRNAHLLMQSRLGSEIPDVDHVDDRQRARSYAQALLNDRRADFGHSPMNSLSWRSLTAEVSESRLVRTGGRVGVPGNSPVGKDAGWPLAFRM